MSKYLTTLLAALLSFSAWSQSSDSLLNLAISQAKTDLKTSQQTFQKALALTKDNAEKLKLYDDYGVELLYMGEYDELYPLTLEALKIKYTKDNYPTYGHILKLKFDIFKTKKEYDSALAIADHKLTLSTTFADYPGQVDMLVEKGGIYETIGDYAVALDLYLKALDIAQRNNETTSEAVAYINLAIFYNTINKPKESIRFNKKAIEIYSKLEVNLKMAQVYNNIGLAHDKLDQFDSARYFFDKGYDIAVDMGSEFGKAITKLNIGLNAYRKKDYQESIRIFDEVFIFFNKISDDYGVCLCHYNYCRIYNALGQTDKAISHGLEAFKIAEEANFLDEVESVSRELSSLYEKRGNMTEALFYFKKNVVARDSLESTSKNQEIGRLESKFELNKSQFENELLSKELALNAATIQSQKYLIFGVLAILILLAFFAYILRKQLLQKKQLNKQIEEQSDKLKELDRAKTRFFANISHDLRTPLSLILGAFDNIQAREEHILDKDSKEELEMGYKNAKRLLFMADEILGLTRLENGSLKINLQFVKISLYLQLLVKMFHSATDLKRIRLTYHADVDQDTLLSLDPYQFEKIIYNLLSNAIKHTHANGSIDVFVRQLKQDNIQIEIRDTGEGIPAEAVPHVFDRFYQSVSNAYNAREGVGIGLALVKEIIDCHKGNIYVKSELGKGTSFFVELPYKEGQWVSDASIPTPSSSLISRNSLWMDLQDNESGSLQVAGVHSNPDGKTLLVVEDHKEVRAYLKTILQGNFRVLTAANGTEAIQTLERENISLILTDLMMPIMDGFELIDLLKKDKRLKKIPVIIISARNSLEEKVTMLDKGIEEVMNKPFDKDELIAKINNLLSKADWSSDKNLMLSSEQLSEMEREILKKVEVLVLSRVNDPHLSVLDISNELAASERKVYRLIKRIAGVTPFELIKEIRWQYIYKKLTNDKIKTATEAAGSIGMANPSDFAKQFEQRFGEPLSAFLSK